MQYFVVDYFPVKANKLSSAVRRHLAEHTDDKLKTGQTLKLKITRLSKEEYEIYTKAMRNKDLNEDELLEFSRILGMHNENREEGFRKYVEKQL